MGDAGLFISTEFFNNKQLALSYSYKEASKDYLVEQTNVKPVFNAEGTYDFEDEEYSSYSDYSVEKVELDLTSKIAISPSFHFNN